MNIPVRLVVSAVQRPPLRQMPLFLLFLFVTWVVAAAGQLGLDWAVAASLCEVAMLGPMSMGALAPKEVRFLPIARRDIWRAGWSVSAIVAPAATMVAKCAALLFASIFNARHVPISLLGVSLVLDVIYSGALIGLMPLQRWFSAKAERNQARPVFKWLAIAIGAIGLAGVIWPLALHSWMPTRWEDVQGITAVVVAFGAVICAGGYFFRPLTSLPPPPRVVARRAPRLRADVHARPGRLTGLSRLFVGDAIATALSASTFIAFMLGVSVLVDSIDPRAKFVDDPGLLPFASASVLGRSGWFLSWIGYSAINLRLVFRADSVAALYRHLRVLPFDTMRLQTLIVGRRLLGWVVMWGVLIAAHVIMIGQWPASLRLDALACVVGIDQFAHALHLRYRWQILIMIVLMPLAGVAKELMARSPPTLEPWYAAIFGLMGLLIAVVMNHSTLRTRSGLYKPAIPTTFSGAFAADPMTR